MNEKLDKVKVLKAELRNRDTGQGYVRIFKGDDADAELNRWLNYVQTPEEVNGVLVPVAGCPQKREDGSCGCHLTITVTEIDL